MWPPANIYIKPEDNEATNKLKYTVYQVKTGYMLWN